MNLFEDIILGPFKLVWETFDPIVAIPLMGIMAGILLMGIAEIMMGTVETDVGEETTTEPDREWKFYPEDFE